LIGDVDPEHKSDYGTESGNGLSPGDLIQDAPQVGGLAAADPGVRCPRGRPQQDRHRDAAMNAIFYLHGARAVLGLYTAAAWPCFLPPLDGLEHILSASSSRAESMGERIGKRLHMACAKRSRAGDGPARLLRFIDSQSLQSRRKRGRAASRGVKRDAVVTDSRQEG